LKDAIAYVMDVEFVWGFQCRVAGMSKTSPSFLYPPPTTVLGALSNVISRELGLGEADGTLVMSSLSENLLAIGWRPINSVPIKYEDINRIISVKITSGRLYPDPSDLGRSFDSPARGKTILSSLDDDSPKIRWVLVFSGEEMKTENYDFELKKKHFWRISRIGSKESLVSVSNVWKIDEVNFKFPSYRGTTNYSFPLLCGVVPKSKLSGKWEYEAYINPFDLGTYSPQDNPVTYYLGGKRILSFSVPMLSSKLRSPEFLLELRSCNSLGGERVVYYEVELKEIEKIGLIGRSPNGASN